jgi:hypothetical protein
MKLLQGPSLFSKRLTRRAIITLRPSHFLGKQRHFPEREVEENGKIYRESAGDVIFTLDQSQRMVRVMQNIQSKLDEE